MSINDLIFSNNSRYRLARHSLFWLGWITYYALFSAIIMWKSHGFAKSFIESFVEVAETTPLDICFCYFIIYYLFPNFLYRGKYVSMLFLWLVASIAWIFLYDLNSMLVVSHIHTAFNIPVPDSAFNDFWSPKNLWITFSLFTQINMEGCVAASIKLGKLRYIKDQEINLLKQEKQKIIPDEEKQLIQPAFLINLLTRVENIANEKPLVVAQSMKKIKNLLLYILYENASSKVPLNKELELLQEYIDLEKITAEKEIDVNASIIARVSSETIAPFIILPLVENAFKQLSNYNIKNPKLEVNVLLQNETINMIVNWSKPMETSSLTNGRNIIMHNISKRLQLIYPQSHELKMMIETEKIIVDLKINLRKAIN